MTRLRKKSVILVAGLIAIITCAVPLFAPMFARSRPAQNASVTFLTVSNRFFDWRHSGKYAVFNLTNGTPHRICLVSTAVYQWTEHGWAVMSLRGAPICDGNGPPPGEAQAIYVPPQATNAPWRLRITCQEQASGFSGIRDRIADFIHNRKNQTRGNDVRITSFSGSTYQIVSGEVTE